MKVEQNAVDGFFLGSLTSSADEDADLNKTCDTQLDIQSGQAEEKELNDDDAKRFIPREKGASLVTDFPIDEGSGSPSMMTGGDGAETEKSGEGTGNLLRPYSYSSLGLTAWKRRPSRNDAGICFGADFGGTLTKIVFFEPTQLPKSASSISNFLRNSERYGRTGERDIHLSFFSTKLGGEFHFIRFETSQTQNAIDILQKLPSPHNIMRLHATGGGAHKFSKLLKRKTGIELIKHDELQTVVRGIVFTLLEHPNSELYSYERKENVKDPASWYNMTNTMVKVPHPIKVANGSLFPLLVVNIGSGVSLLKVESPNQFQRVSGTALGGGTYYGLCKLLCGCENFDDAMDLAEVGDSRRVNLLVKDIYGGSYDSVGLAGDVTASFFGKAASAKELAVAVAGSTLEVPKDRANTQQVGFWEMLGLLVVAILSSNLLYSLTQNLHSMTDVIRAIVLLFTPGALAIGLFMTLSASADRDSMKSRAGKPSDSSQVARFQKEDIASALVVMIAQNVTQIALLNARLHGISKVVFTGNFLRHNKIAQYTLTTMMTTWSQGEVSALFMQHEGYFGAMGSFLYSSGLDAKGEMHNTTTTTSPNLRGDRAKEKRDED